MSILSQFYKKKKFLYVLISIDRQNIYFTIMFNYSRKTNFSFPYAS